MEKLIVSKVKIIIESSDGSNMELNSVMPKDVAQVIAMSLIEWEDNWDTNFKFARDYFKAERDFLDQEKESKQ